MAEYLPPVRLAFVLSDKGGWQLFFEPIDLGSQAADLSIQFVELLSMGSLERGNIVASLKDGSRTFAGLAAPLTQDIGMHAILGADLSERLFFFEQIQRDLGFEGGSVNLFHRETYLSSAQSSV